MLVHTGIFCLRTTWAIYDLFTQRFSGRKKSSFHPVLTAPQKLNAYWPRQQMLQNGAADPLISRSLSRFSPVSSPCWETSVDSGLVQWPPPDVHWRRGKSATIEERVSPPLFLSFRHRFYSLRREERESLFTKRGRKESPPLSFAFRIFFLVLLDINS